MNNFSVLNECEVYQVAGGVSADSVGYLFSAAACTVLFAACVMANPVTLAGAVIYGCGAIASSAGIGASIVGFLVY